ncbi:MAG: peptidylprolyl isomerase [Cytophagales bacterium]|nr:peptidylprolyl isomerase [Cytophagales bacterium]
MPIGQLFYDSLYEANGSLEEGLALLAEGDSIELQIKASILFEKTFMAPLPEEIDPESLLTFFVGLPKITTREGFQEMQMAAYETHQKKQLETDKEIIQKYLNDNQLQAEQTESGLSYTISQTGTGKQAEAGKLVKVNYTGKLLTGEVFDSSLEDVAKESGNYNPQRPYEPFSFPLGQGRVIPGWDEGISLLSEGAKATLYIPSTLAYGSRGAGGKIPANAVLVFDVELLEVGE